MRTRQRTRRDIVNENAELRGAIAELRKQVADLTAKLAPVQPAPLQPAAPPSDLIEALKRLLENPIYPPFDPMRPWWEVRPYDMLPYTWCGTTTLDASALSVLTTVGVMGGNFKVSS